VARGVGYHPVVHPTNLFKAASLVIVCCVSFAQQGSTPQLASQEPPPYWAFTVDPPQKADTAKPTDNEAQHVPGSKQSFTRAQIADLYAAPDWHPDTHPAMPDVVATGQRPGIFACAYCHLPNGLGRPENASLAGLSQEYIVQQMTAFKSGARNTSQSGLLPVINMVHVAQLANKDQVRIAAQYFSSLKPKPWIRVVEAATVPRTQVAGWMLVADQPVVQEPIGNRIIETPENLERTELRDDTSGFVAYVPKGSLKAGKFLVEKGGDGVTMPCSACHGADLRGKDNVPSIAGRSPSYIVRQLYDLQRGSRGGSATDQMQIPVMKLTMNDMVAMAAYLASLKP
jgi:cytochrome c553